MYADRYGPQKLNTGSLGLSVTIVGGLVAAAMLSNTVIRIAHHEKILKTYPVPPAPRPPKPETQPEKRADTQTRQHIDQPIRDTPIDQVIPLTPPFDPGPPIATGDGGGGGVVLPIDPPKPPPPVMRGPDVDGRYARNFQPVYPAEERRAGREGVVMLKVLIGVDGRVREVERISAASDAFWRVTQERALAKWRFRPATRDGVPYETWKTMTVRFKLEEE